MFAGHLIIPRADHLPPLPDITPLEKFRCEKEILGFSASCHPLELFPSYMQKDCHSPLGAMVNRKAASAASAAAWMVDIKRIKTREKKETMVFLTFEDLHDTFEVVLFPDTYQKYAELIRQYRFLQVSGELSVDGGNTSIIAEALSPAPTGLAEQPYI
jgi:DNA polymerase-3 subunit alpha